MMKTIVLILLSFVASAQLSTYDLTCEHLTNPIGIDVKKPRLSWKLKSDKRNTSQTAYLIEVSESTDFNKKSIVWTSTKVNSSTSILQMYAGPLKSRTRYFWRVKVWDNQSQESTWSAPSLFETGLLSKSEWVAKWIEIPNDTMRISPAIMLRKDFPIKKKIKEAKAYVTAHGIYELYLNGQKIGDQVLTPGWTSYNKRLQYQVYDVTNQINQGKNAVGAMLADGWYRGNLGWQNKYAVYGNQRGLLCQIHVKYTDNSEEIITSDADWKASQAGPIRMADIYNGETFDATKTISDWATPAFNDSKWHPVQVANYNNDVLVASMGAPIKRIQEIIPVRIFRTPKGTLVADFGQNMVGWVKLKIKGQSGTRLKMQHAEVLDKYGEFYTDNLRTAQATATYIIGQTNVEETYEPRFTFFGFRYFAIEGLPANATLTNDNLTAVVVHSEIAPTGDFSCSNPLINQLQSNIKWGQKGNFLDVPTDCPQRDERLGWTGDAQAFVRTATFNANVSAFFTKWLADVKADQCPGGEVPFVVPDALNPQGSLTVPTSAGWGDVAVIAPWTIYEVYGDKTLLAEQYGSMKAWVEYIRSKSGNNLIWKNGSVFGDWLFYVPASGSTREADGHTNQNYIATAFFAYSTKLTAQAAQVLGKTEDAKMYNELFEQIKVKFNNEYVTPSGRTASDSQTSYILALMFDLLPENQRPKAVEYLVEDIKGRKNHLSTGFLGTPYITKVLSDNGQTDVAYDLLFQETYPSWLYPVKMGATTIWERWDGQKPDSTFQTTGMNSFNHYAYGAIGDWMYRVVAGIEIGEAGYKHILIQPHPTTKLDFAKASFESSYGQIVSHWSREGGKMKLQVEVPANTTATIMLPEAKVNQISADGQIMTESAIYKNIKAKNKSVQVEVGSGSYVFEW
jgi:alpha-L-rhamnosidase